MTSTTSDSRRIRIEGPGIVVRGNDIDTDRIIPARYLRTVTFDGLGAHAFEDDRAEARRAGRTHPFDDPRFSAARILLVSNNFGCGSSREHAPQALSRWGQGLRAIVGESFAEIFFGNCLALGIPCIVVQRGALESLMQSVEHDPDASVVVDLDARQVTSGSTCAPLDIPEAVRQALTEGRWDTTAELLAGRDAIARTAARLPYLGDFR